ncbi:GDP-mannose 4,6-dehydratase [Dorea sp. YH-dor228]|uniref:GDP-mannose 4,6-dehydratase n=1 Tax=Lachnospiraceae TaxID=186803 RepID=UPI0032420B8D
MDKKIILITGAAGFIGFFLSKRILEENKDNVVIGYDNLNDYYDVRLKNERLQLLDKFDNFVFIRGDLRDRKKIKEIFEKYSPDIVINLAAQAGVRYSITNPEEYIDSNIIGFFNLLECCRHSYDSGENGVKHLVYASSSSVYGLNKKVPYSVEDKVDNPVSLYAATKKSNELMAYAYSKLYDIPVTGLRFFTVYGPMGRPDMAYFSFADKMVKNEKIQIFNYGNMYRDFTYIDDIVDGILRIMKKVPKQDENGVKYKVYNIGNNKPESLMDFVKILENLLMSKNVIEKSVEKEYLPMQPGDVYQTYADISELKKDFGYAPNTRLEDGLEKFVDWYKEYLRR